MGAYAIPNPGNGTDVAGDTPQAFMFLITDGMSDEYTCNASNVCTSGRTRSAMQAAQLAQCTALKNRKIKIAILYTEYTYASIEDDEAGQLAYRDKGDRTASTGRSSIADGPDRLCLAGPDVHGADKREHLQRAAGAVLESPRQRAHHPVTSLRASANGGRPASLGRALARRSRQDRGPPG